MSKRTVLSLLVLAVIGVGGCATVTTTTKSPDGTRTTVTTKEPIPWPPVYPVAVVRVVDDPVVIYERPSRVYTYTRYYDGYYRVRYHRHHPVYRRCR